MVYTNYHTHSLFCDGNSSPEVITEMAISLGMQDLGFSSHAPVPFTNQWSMKFDMMQQYANTIDALKEKYRGQLNIYKGLEIDHIPGITNSINYFKEQMNLDYTIGGIHLVKPAHTDRLWFIDGPEINYHKGMCEIYKYETLKAVTDYFHQLWELINEQTFDIIAHFDKVKMHNKGRYFNEEADWFIAFIDQTLELIKKKNIIVEVNTRGIYKGRCEQLFPGEDTLAKCLKMDIPVTISTDAHAPEDLLKLYDETVDTLKHIGFKGIYRFTGNRWEQQDF